jgi:maltooligosyltrehalose synthase
MNVPRATYRLQLRAGFGFSRAAAIAPYLAKLGVSHVYLSPIFKARPGSVHGYDITDHNELNPELGTEADYSSMIEAFRRERLGRILDVVPNHMGVWGADNPLWLDVLEWGPSSRYAGWFDIDWSAQQGKLPAPVLGAQYGEELRSGKLRLNFETDGSFAVWAYDSHKLPICPLARALKGELVSLANEDSGVGAAIETQVEELNKDRRELDRLINEQFWASRFIEWPRTRSTTAVFSISTTSRVCA